MGIRGPSSDGRGAPPASAAASTGTGADLNAKQRRFCLEYLVDLNGTQAAIRAGYSARSAHVQAHDLLRNPKIRAFLDPRLRKAEQSLELTVERLEQELVNLAYFDPADLLDPETGATLPVHRWPERARRALAGFEEEALFEEVPTGEVGPRGGVKKERVQVGVVRKFKWHNKSEAIALGMKRRGALTEKHELVGPANVTINIGVRKKKPGALKP